MRLARWSVLGVLSCAGRAHPPAAPDARTPPIRRDTRGAVALAAGDDHTCAAHRDGHVSCWGSDAARPDQRSAHRDVPRVIDGLRDVVSLRAGAFHRCALRRGGEVSCWGAGNEGQIGDGDREDRWTPVRVRWSEALPREGPT